MDYNKIEHITKQDIITEDFSELIIDFSTKELVQRYDVKGSTHKSTNTEKKLITIHLTLLNVDELCELLVELHSVGCDLNSIVYSIDSFVFPLFGLLQMNLNDNDTCKLIDTLTNCNYKFNERTYYNGGNNILSLLLAFKPKSAIKLLELGVDCNVKNVTLDTVYSATKNIAEYLYPEEYDELLKSNDLFNNKNEIIKEYKNILKLLEDKNISDDVTDKLYLDVEKYIADCVEKNHLSMEEEDLLRHFVYETYIARINTVMTAVVDKN